MIQFKKKLRSKSVILLLLCLTTTTTKGFLQDENRRTRIDENIREDRLSMERQLENSQNLPIRNADTNRHINQKDRIIERLYDRRSFRTGTIETDRENREMSIKNGDVRTDNRDINNNRRDIPRNLLIYRQDSPQENRPIRVSRETRVVRNRDINARETRRIFDIHNSLNGMDSTNYNSGETRASELQEDRNRQLSFRQNTNSQFTEREIRRSTERRSLDQNDNRRMSVLPAASQNRLSNEHRDLDERRYLNRRFIRSTEVEERRLSERRNLGGNQLRTRSVRNHRLDERRNLDQRQYSLREFTARYIENQNQRISERRNLEVSPSRTTSMAFNRIDERRIVDQRQLLDREIMTRSIERQNQRAFERRNMAISQIRAIQLPGRSLDRLSERFNLAQSRRSVDSIIRLGESSVMEGYRTSGKRLNTVSRYGRPFESISDERSRERIVSDEETTQNNVRRIREARAEPVGSARNNRRSVERQEQRSAERRESRNPFEEPTRNILERRPFERESYITSKTDTKSQNRRQINGLRYVENRERRFTDRREGTASFEKPSRNLNHDRENAVREVRTDFRRYNTGFMENQNRRSIERRTLDQRRTMDREKSTERRETSVLHSDRRTLVGLDHFTDRRRVTRVPEQTRSDSTRKIRDNARIRNNRGSVNRITREDTRGNDYNTMENDLEAVDIYNPLTSDSRRYFERLVSERTSSASSNDMASLGFLRNADSMKIDDSGIWGNTAKILLAVFLIGQFFADSSKAKKYRFHSSIMSMMNRIKEKVQ